MCGISALYRFTFISGTDREKLVAMNREMHYRGPDENDTWVDDTCGLAHTRLSIIGPDNGKQPLFNEDGSLVLICNGEIYNYVELKKLLQSKGHIFSTLSDNETILHLYEEYGRNCLDHLRGMFAFCLYDKNKKLLFTARDRIGEKTLYYAQIQTGLVFCSELKTILKFFIDKPQIDAHALAECLRYNHPLDLRNTWIEQIKRLQAGEYALVDCKGIELHRYWKRDLTPAFEGSQEEAKRKTLDLMRESVDVCLRSDLPVAILLSGGIDSCTVAALAQETGREVHTITVGYKGQHDCDERETARRFAREMGFMHHEIELDTIDFEKNFQEYTCFIDEPVCDVSSMSQWAIYKKASELGFKVLLGGLGGDELFYGYPYWNKVAGSLQLTRMHQSFFPWKGLDKKTEFLKFFFRNWKHVLWAGYPYKINESLLTNWTYNDFYTFASTGSYRQNGEAVLFRDIEVHQSFGDKGASIEQVYATVFSTFMTTLCLYLADRLGMGNSTEIRSPLIDYKLIEFVSSLPVEMKYKKDEPKWFMKEVIRDHVPGYILTAPKRGFTPPKNFIEKLNEKYEYQFFSADSKFFNSVLSDRLISRLLN